MFSKKITDSDAFIEMSSAAQALYFHLNQSADDDGFNNQVQIAMMKAHASVDDLKVLMLKKFVIRFENGLLVIKHWRMHNTLRMDRYTPTAFQDELAMLKLKPNLSYTLGDDGKPMVAERLPDGCRSIDKISIDKEREDIGAKSTRFTPPTLEEVTAYCKEKQNGVDPVVWWNFYDSKNWYVGKNKMVKWKSAIATWAQKDKPVEQEKPKPKKYREVVINGETVMEVVNE